MATSYSTLLGLALPVQGELSGTWGDTVNNYITNYLDSAVAGTQTLSSDADVTLTKTTGTSLGTTSSQYAILNCTGARTAQRTITVPAASKIYHVINATTGGFAVKLVGAGPTTGVTVANGEKCLVAWNGSDFVKVALQGGAGSYTTLNSTGGALNGSIGATTPSTGAFTTLSASSTVSGAGITALMASPGPIGSTTPSTGAFTTLSASGVTQFNDSAISNNGKPTYWYEPGTTTWMRASSPSLGVWKLDSALGDLLTATRGSGLAVTGTLSATSDLTLSNTDGKILGGTAAGRAIWGNSGTTTYAVAYGASHATFPNQLHQVAGSATSILSSTGLSVTGALSATGAISTDSQVTISKDGSDTIGVGSLVQIRNAAATRSWATQLSASNNLDWWHLNGSWSKYMTLSSTGLSVTGTLSATGSSTSTQFQATGGAPGFSTSNQVTGASRAEFTNSGGTLYVGLDNSSGGLGGPYTANFWHSGNYSIVFATNNVERGRFTGNGLAVTGIVQPSTDLVLSTGQLTTNSGSNPLLFGINNSVKMTLDSSGNLGLGVTPSAWSTSNMRAFQVGASTALLDYSSAGNRQTGLLNNAYFNTIGSYYYSNTDPASRYHQTGGVHYWYTAASGTAGTAITWTQAMTLDASGNLLVGATTQYSTEKVFFRRTADTSGAVFVVENTAATATNQNGQYIRLAGDPNDATRYFIACVGNSTDRAVIRSNGGLANFSANNVNLSDERLKKDFAPAKSYYAKWQDIEFVTFLYKDQTDTELNLGVKAQQLESVFPELIDNSGFGEAPEGEEPYKAVYQTDFQYATAKALQEAIAKIEMLEARIAALEAK